MTRTQDAPLYRDAAAGQVPCAEVASGAKVDPVIDSSSQVDRRQVHPSHRFGQIPIASRACDYLNTGKV
jgi:hypothetical protein